MSGVFVDDNGYIVITGDDFTAEDFNKAYAFARTVNDKFTYEKSRMQAIVKRRVSQRNRINKERQHWRNTFYRRPKTLAQEALERKRAALFHGKKKNFKQIPWSERQKNNYVKFVRERKCK